MGSKKQSTVIGYKYRIHMHYIICHGQLDSFEQIWFADKIAWAGNLTPPETQAEVTAVVSNENLFGGTNSEGGVAGLFGVGFGGDNQTMTGVKADGTYGSYLGKAAPSMAVNYRGLAVVNLYNFYVGMSAYLKDVSFVVARYFRKWYPEKALIGDNMNPAHIIYECITNTRWGMGYKASTINDAAFRGVADTLFAEGLGLSLIWDADQEFEDFIEDIKEVIDGNFYLDRRTGLWTISLNRAGGSAVLELTPSNIISLESFSRRAYADTYNEISASYTNPETEDSVSLTVQDIANIQSQGTVNQLQKNYRGVRSSGVCAALAQRDLQAASATLATAEVVANRQAWILNPGDIIVFRWPAYGIAGLEMRVSETSQSESGTDSIKVTLVENVFGLANASFIGLPETGYNSVYQAPQAFSPLRFWELPFWYVWNGYGDGVSSLTTSDTFSTMLAATNVSARQQVLYHQVLGLSGAPEWQIAASGAITPTGKLLTAINRGSSTTVKFTDLTYQAQIEDYSFLLISDGTTEELCQISTAFTDTDATYTLKRGLMDTQPVEWPANARVWFIGTKNILVDPTQRTAGADVSYRSCMQTNLGLKDVNSVATVTANLSGRFGRPYPPQNVTIEGGWWPTEAEINTKLKVDWSRRNRLLQDGNVQVLWGDADIVPEAGTTYGYTLKNAAGTIIDSATGITGTHADISVPPGPKTTYTITLYAERDGLRNYIDFTHTMDITATGDGGYGLAYGQAYGQ